MPFAFIPFLLLIVPIIEIGAFIAIGGQIGIGLTLLMILVTAIIGSFLLRHQGLSLLNKIQTEISGGRVPGRALGDGAMIVIAGILLLTPGFVTDSIGFLLFFPPFRSILWSFFASRIKVGVPGGEAFGQSPFGQAPFGQAHHEQDVPEGDGPIIDLDSEDYQTGPPDPNSPWNKNKDTNE